MSALPDSNDRHAITDEPGALRAEILREQLANSRRVNLVRLIAVTAFFALFLLLGVVLGKREWQGNLVYFGPYWLATLALTLATARWPIVGRFAGLSIAVIDVPVVFLLQWSQFPTSPNAGAIAGYNIGIYVFLVVLAALALDARIVYATALVAAIFEGLLQYLAGISTGAIVASFVVLGLAGAACSYGSRRLLRLVERVALDLQARRRADVQLAETRDKLALAQRETEIAQRIQTSILPPVTAIPGFDIAARMTPMEQVGGDYYDVRVVDRDGFWIGIGDVSGHGLTAGLIMMMVQTAVASLTLDGDVAVEAVVERVNRVIYDNIHNRLGTKDFVTFSLLRLAADGRIVVAGQHEPLIIYRAADRTCEVVDVLGIWLGMRAEIADLLEPVAVTLAPGDLLVLHTDGVTEARDRSGKMLELPGLVAAIERGPTGSAGELVAHLEREVASWAAKTDDDVTLLVVRYQPA